MIDPRVCLICGQKIRESETHGVGLCLEYEPTATKTIDSQYPRVIPTKLRALECPAWPPETCLSRLQSCRVMLALHGILTDEENERCKKRIAKIANEEE